MKNNKKDLQQLRDTLIEEAKTKGLSSPEGKKALESILALDDHLSRRKAPWVSPDTIVNSAVALAMTLLILAFERNHAVTGKAFTFLRPPR